MLPPMVNSLVSIVMPAYNAESTIAESIESVLNQSYQHWELIIVDNNSTDATKDIIHEYSSTESRIIFKYEKEKGAHHARNTGISVAKGNYLAFLDCDDIWVRSKLEIQINYMVKMSCPFTSTSYRPFFEVQEQRIYKNVRTVPSCINLDSLLKTCTVGLSSVVIDLKQVQNIKFPCCDKEDYALWVLLAQQGVQLRGIDVVSYDYRIGSSSLSSNKIKEILRQWRVYRNIAKLGAFDSFIYLVSYIFFGIMKRF